MPSSLETVSFPTEYVRHQYASVKAYLEDEYLGQGTLCIAESQVVWGFSTDGNQIQGLAIDYPSLTMHGIVTHDPKYPEEHLVVVVQKSDDDEQSDDDERSASPVEYDSIRTVNYRFVMATSEDLKVAYQTIAECQALHPDPLEEAVEDDEVGSDIDYGNEDEEEQQHTNGNGNHEDDDPYGYNAHFASFNRGTRGSSFGSHRRGYYPDQGENNNENETNNQNEEMDS